MCLFLVFKVKIWTNELIPLLVSRAKITDLMPVWESFRCSALYSALLFFSVTSLIKNICIKETMVTSKASIEARDQFGIGKSPGRSRSDKVTFLTELGLKFHDLVMQKIWPLTVFCNSSISLDLMKPVHDCQRCRAGLIHIHSSYHQLHRKEHVTGDKVIS